MSYQLVFPIFWEKVKESIQNGTYAKLTLAKTIGDTEIKNVFMRPVIDGETCKFSLTERFKTEEIENTVTFDEAYTILYDYIKNPFLTALLFTTENDITFKVNKKNAGTITEQAATFKNPYPVIIEMKEKGII